MKSAQELAQSLGVNEATLRLWRAEAGIAAKARGVGYSDAEIAQIEAIAAHKRQRKPRKGQDSANIPVISAERQKYAVNDSADKSMDSANNSAYFATTDANSANIPDVSAQLEQVISRLDALTALLERAAIAPRYVKRETVEDALDERPKRAIGKHERPKRADGHRLGYFCGLHGVPERTARDQVLKGCYEVTIIPINSHQEYYVAPAQEAGIIAYWQRVSYPYTKCPECPHQEVQE